MTKKKVTITGLGTMLMAGAAYLAWKKSVKQRAKKIENMYYNNVDERDIAWG